jgi:hypothetical protein
MQVEVGEARRREAVLENQSDSALRAWSRKRAGSRSPFAAADFRDAGVDQIGALMHADLIEKQIPFAPSVFANVDSLVINSVAKGCEPFGRPVGFPDCPGRNCVARGGFLYPAW